MKKILAILLCVVMLVSVLASCGNNEEEDTSIPDEMTSSDGKYEVAMVTDIGQLKDGSFNEGTWEGVKSAAVAAGKSYKYYQPSGGENAGDQERIDAFNLAIANGAKIIVCPGYAFANALDEVVPANPDVKFVFVDGWAIGQDNLTAICYKEEQAGYFAGYAAAMEGYVNLGGTFGGGSTNAACNRYCWGYIQGIIAGRQAKLGKSEDLGLTIRISFQYGSSFQASSDLQNQLTGWYNAGTEVIFACGGSMCQSAFAAASAEGKKVIGVDVDQSSQSQTVITSATKGLAVSVEKVIADWAAGKWDELSDVCQNMGAESDAVGLPTATWSLTNYTVEEYNQLFNSIKSGDIVIDNSSTWADIEAAIVALDLDTLGVTYIYE